MLPAAGNLVTAVHAHTSVPTLGTANTRAQALIGGNAPAFLTNQQGIAMIDGAPSASSVNSILSSNPAIAAAFNATTNPTYFGIGELGAAYSAGGTGPETETAQFSETVDLTQVNPLQDLIVGFYQVTSSGTGIQNLTLSITGAPASYSQSFSSATAAKNYFQSNPTVDLGALSGSTLNLQVSLSITAAAPGSFELGLLIGDPPPAGQDPSQGSWTFFGQNNNPSPLGISDSSGMKSLFASGHDRLLATQHS